MLNDGSMKKESRYIFKFFGIEDQIPVVLDILRPHVSSDTKRRLATTITDWRIDVCFTTARRKFN